jgi:Concanavalin A-like lectin/glucanases superfamily/Bacterial Ig domain/Immunoglobulin domain
VIFGVIAAGTQPIAYQWRLNGTNLAAATVSSLVLTNVQVAQAGAYSVLLSNSVGTLLSSNAILTVIPAPPCATPPPGLVSWWKAEGTALDQAGSNNGVLQNGVNYAAGRAGLAFDFDPASGSVMVPDSSSLQLTNQLTIEAWINTRGTNTDYGIVSKVGGAAGNNGYQFALSGNTLLGQFNSPGQGWPSSLVTASGVIATGVWYHVAWTYDQSAMTLYVNGLPVATNVIGPKPIVASSSNLRISGDDNLHVYFDGLIDEPSIYNRALSSAEIQAIYNAGGSGKCTSAAPVIVSPPASLTVNAGQTATFTVLAGGTRPLSYQWLLETNPIGGATGSSLMLVGVQPQQAGNYSVIVTNPYGLVTSSNAVLSVLTFPPAIITQPANQTASAGTTVVFTVTASGSPPLNYQWFLETNPITVATNSSLVLNNVQPTQAGNYSVVVSNAYGTATSSNALLTVLTFPPTIISQPQSRTMFQGRTTNFSVTATGTAPLSYQWFFNSNSLTGRTASTLALTNIQPDQAGPYSVLVTNAYGSLMSSNAFLTVLPPPVCVSPPAGLVVWWRAESNTVDSIGLNDAVLQFLKPDFMAGKVGAAWHLSQGGYLRVPASSDLNLGSGAGLTIEGWIRPDILSGAQPLAEWNNGQGIIGAGLMINYNTGYGALEGYLTDTNAKPTRSIVLRSPANTVTNFLWQHVALSFDKASGVAAMYVNGISVAQTNLGTFVPATAQAPFYLGYRPSGSYAGYRFTGGLDEMSLYNRGLTASEIQSIVLADDQGKCPPPPPPCLPPVSGIVAWWRGQSNALDSVDSNTGLITSTVTYTTGKVATCFQFSTGYIRVPAASNLNVGVGPGLTIELWAKPTLWAPQPFVEWNSGTGAQGPTLCYPTAAPVLEANVMDTLGVSHLIQSPQGLITNNVWEHLAVTYDKASGIAALYFNGTVVTQRNLGTFTPRTASDVYLGYRPPGNYSGSGGKFTGGMDEISLYGRALGSNEVRAIYSARDAGKCATPAPPFIIWQPANRTVTLGGTATFTLQPPAGTPPFSYQWGHAGTNIAGASSSSLSLPGVTLASAGAYSVVVTNVSGSITSAVATLTVNQPPTAFNVTAATKQNVPMSILTEKLLMFASDPEGDPLTVVSVGTSTNGATVVLGGGAVTYTPVTGFIGTDRFAYTVGDSWGGTGSAFVQVEVRPADQCSGNMLQPIITDAGCLVRFAAIPGRTYTIQRAESLSGPWFTLTTVTVGPSGLGVYEDTNAPPAGAYYRTTYP